MEQIQAGSAILALSFVKKPNNFGISKFAPNFLIFMLQEQPELPRVNDLAARQAMDATRLFREYTRVRRELAAFKGSLYFKKVGVYEYLLHKVRGDIHRKGRRSPVTEAQHADFQSTKERLKARLKILQENVATHQRMNKAVHAGAVPSEVIEVLTQLEAHGLADKSVILGAPALYAYGQSSGVKLDSVKLEGQNGKLLASHPDVLRVLLQSPQRGTVQQLMHALSAVAKVEASVACNSSWWDLKLHFVSSMSKDGAKAAAKRQKPTQDALVAETGKALLIHTKAGASQRSTQIDAWAKLFERAPAYEQVVVGKTGKMAVMRTLDPQVFVRWEQARQRLNGLCADEKTAHQLRLVEELLETSMVVTKLDGVASEALNEEVLALAAAGELAPHDV